MNDLTYINYNIIEKNDNICFICLDDLNYYIKFDCKCHNNIHKECILYKNLTKCYICHKKLVINMNNNIEFNDTDNIVNYLLYKLKIEYIMHKLIDFLNNNTNLYGYMLYIIGTISITFLIVIPIIVVSLFVELLLYLYMLFKKWL